MRTPRKIDEIALRKIWFSKLPDKIMAERLGHHRGVLRRRAMKLGLPLRREAWARELST